jgi:group II intron reverse transcriptase/maturase
LGRIPGQRICNYSSTAGDSSTVKSDAIRKLLWLGEKCNENKNYEVRDIYTMMYNKKLFEMAYNSLKSNPGNMTPGMTPTTLDGFSADVIQETIEKLKDNSFQFQPGRRVMIPKASGGERPLTVAPPRDKIVQEVMRMILEVIFEPSFSPNSHGFRTNKSCHTALKQVFNTFGVATWYIEGDISKCFDSFDHNILINIIRSRIKDERFIRLIIKALKAGYFEFNEYRHSIIGTPQGSIISPILCNIYMNEFDKFMEGLAEAFSKGIKPRGNPLWISYSNKKRRSLTIEDKVKWHKLMLNVPSKDPMDPNFKKLVYVRYADDWLVGVRGSREDCVALLLKIKKFLLEDLNLNLSEKKTLITNASKEKALFLGTHIFRSRHQIFSRSMGFIKRIGKEVRLEAPIERATKKLRNAKFLIGDVTAPRFLWLHNSKDQIIALYNSVYRGYANYYSFAHNLGSFSGYVHMLLKSSCAKLLAAKFKLGTQKKVFETYGKNLKGKDNIAFVDPIYRNNPWDFKVPASIRTESKITDNGILGTLYAESISVASLEGLSCSACGSNHRVEMHHVRHLKDLNPSLSKIDALMVKNRRKQIALCRKCHLEHHTSSSL